MADRLRQHRFVDHGNAYPMAYHLGQNLTIDATTPYQKKGIELSPSEPFLTLDYGTDRSGFPIFCVESLSDATQIEVKYSEEFPALALPQSDGPYTFTVGLASTFRIETLNLTEPGKLQNYFIQGGQRWQTLRLLTNTTIVLSEIGFNSTAPLLEPSQLPGKLSTSNPIYNGLFDLGGGSSHVSCIDAGNAPSTWDITQDGALIRGQTTAQSANGASFSNYTLSFSTKIVRGGTGWRIASGQQPFGSYFLLTSNEQALLNTNRSFITPNTILFTYGTSLYPQETITTGPAWQYPINATIEDDTWYNLSTAMTPEAYVISIDDHVVLSIPIADFAELASDSGIFGTGSPFTGSFGFGPYQDQAAYYKDIVVTSNNGSLLYENPMTSEEILGEYAQLPLDTSLCLDGGKRDRLVWTGDFYHTVNVVASSTALWDHLLGTIDFVFKRQKKETPFKDLVPISPFMGSPPEYEVTGLYGGLLDYQDLFLAGVADFYRYTGQSEQLKSYWPNIKALAAAKLEFIDPYSGLVGSSPDFAQIPISNFLGPVNGTAVTAVFAYALKELVPLAHAIGDTASAELYETTSASLIKAINDKLWNPTLGTYSLSLDAPSNYSLTAIGWAILAGAANTSQVTSSFAKLDELKCGIGYRTISSEACTEDYQLSPNTNGFLLNALFKAQRDLGVRNLTIARSQLEDFWPAMLTQNEYYSGASWEYVHPDGSPGLNRFTSLSHPWGAAPTYVLPEYVLGISATSAGYKSWSFTPMLEGLDIEFAKGTVVTAYGDINASWQVEGEVLVVETNVPRGTSATLVLPDGYRVRYHGKSYRGGEVPLRSGGMVKLALKQC
jgi:hypothetical protein